MKIMRSLSYGMLLILLLVIVSVSVSGCSGISSKGSAQSAYAVTVNVSEIDAALTNGPVFVDFGSEWCLHCRQEQPVIQNLTKEYGCVTFIHVDSDVNWELDRSFMLSGMPQMDVIVRKNPDGGYLYVGPDGNTTTDRQASRVTGLTEQGDLEKLLNAAITTRTTG